MNLNWSQITPRLYAASTADGTHVELLLDETDGSWHVFATAPELDGVDYMGEDLHGAIHLTTCLIAPNHQITTWTIHDKGQVQVLWDLDTDNEPPAAPPARSRWARLLRRAEPQ